MPDLTVTDVVVALLLRDIDDRKVLFDPERGLTCLDLPDGERPDISRGVLAREAAGECWLPADTLVWHLTDRGREVLDRGAA
jgi:hypothetical protein